MPSKIIAPRSDESSDRDRIVEEAIRQIASLGVRGATLRSVAAGSGCTLAGIVTLFGTKDGLIAECFREVVRRDREYLAALAGEAAAMAIGPELAGPFLWTLCEEASGGRRADMLVLVELWVSAPSHPHFAPICIDWLRARRDALRSLAGHFGVAPMAFDLLGLHLLSESVFAVSCHSSPAYRLIARGGFMEACVRLAGLGHQEAHAAIEVTADHFYAEPDHVPANDDDGGEGRGAEGRARIVDAAAVIIERDGFAAVTNRAVADQAGVSVALTGYHFKSVAELAVAGIVRVFEKTNANVRRDAKPAGAASFAKGIGDAPHRTGVGQLASRGMAEISLVAARSPALAFLGLAMRRQRGTVTYASLGGDRSGISRTTAASHALWSSATLLIQSVPGEEGLYDFGAQARVMAKAMFDLS
ncbi:transcriptional regulator, TetR family [Sphingomonas laterariae]|uniref:Transcriptional regulator, TetR family n=1 Tax=Edaphosphingomonas laterariae TaxID=861865 RepID=A0A239CCD8_9SPHN|nr:TetR family transcriptional regulator [Sphingomonas laterariae]SNS17328.1 transcriptional regulator, TetR family [Sphingomonas laterariae]